MNRQLEIRKICILAALAFLLPLSAKAGNFAVRIDKTACAPSPLTVPAGSNIVFQNNDDVPHEVISKKGEVFDIKVAKSDESDPYMVEKPGTYDVDCGGNTKMKLIVN